MVKVTKKHASGGQGINPLAATLVPMTGQRPVMGTIKICLATVTKGWLPAGPPEAILSPYGLRPAWVAKPRKANTF